jgi:hypothetical protein
MPQHRSWLLEIGMVVDAIPNCSIPHNRPRKQALFANKIHRFQPPAAVFFMLCVPLKRIPSFAKSNFMPYASVNGGNFKQGLLRVNIFCGFLNIFIDKPHCICYSSLS